MTTISTPFPTFNLVNDKNSMEEFFSSYSPDLIDKKFAVFCEAREQFSIADERCALAEDLVFMAKVAEILKEINRERAERESICSLASSFSEETLVAVEGVVNLIKQAIPVGVIYNLSKNRTELDLIVVLEKSCTKPYTAFEHVIDLVLPGYREGTCTIHNYGLLNAQLLSGHLFYSNVCVERNVVYRKNIDEVFSYADTSILEMVKIKSANLFSAGITKAINFYKGAQQYLADELYEMAVFMLQQACELTYRCLLNVLRGKDLKCHSPIILRKHVKRFAPEIIGIFSMVEEQEIYYLQVLEDAYIKSRYQVDYTIEKDLIFFLNAKVGKLQDCAKTIFNQILST